MILPRTKKDKVCKSIHRWLPRRVKKVVHRENEGGRGAEEMMGMWKKRDMPGQREKKVPQGRKESNKFGVKFPSNSLT